MLQLERLLQSSFFSKLFTKKKILQGFLLFAISQQQIMKIRKFFNSKQDIFK